MSFILDALKRSERERARVAAEAAPVEEGAAHRAAPAVTWIVISLLLVAFVLAGAWWWWRSGTVPSRVTEIPVALPAPAPVPAPAPKAEPAARPKPAVGAAPAPRAEIPATPATATPAPERPPPITVPPTPPPTGPVVIDPKVVPFLSQLPADFQQSLPPMTVNIHVYVPDESARVLFINNRQVQKGEWLSGSVRLEEIVADGAVMSYQGVRFKLPRPR